MLMIKFKSALWNALITTLMCGTPFDVAAKEFKMMMLNVTTDTT